MWPSLFDIIYLSPIFVCMKEHWGFLKNKSVFCFMIIAEGKFAALDSVVVSG